MRACRPGKFLRKIRPRSIRKRVTILFSARSTSNPSQFLTWRWKKGPIERIRIESCTRNIVMPVSTRAPHVGTSYYVGTSDAYFYVWVARWYAFSRCRRTDGDCVRFRVDRRLIDMNQDRKNQRDQTQPRYTQVGPQLFSCSRGITLRTDRQVKSGCSVVGNALFVKRYRSARIVIIKMVRDLTSIT